MKKVFTVFILLSLIGLNSVFAQQKIFYVKGASSPYSIYSANLDGTGETLIVTGIPDYNFAGYGGGKICYSNGTEIYLVNPDGSNNISVPNTTDAYGDLDVSYDGSKIVYSGNPSNYKLFIINSDGTGKSTFNDGSGVSQHQSCLTWNEAGKIFWVISNYGDAFSQRIYSKVDNNPLALPTQLVLTFAQYPESGGLGNKVAYNDQPGNLFVMNSDGSGQTQLSAAGIGNKSQKAWDLAANTLFYVNSGNIWKIKPDNTGLTQVTITGNIVHVIGIGSVSCNASILTQDTIVHISNPVTMPVLNTDTLHTSCGIISYQFDMTYDPAKLQYVNKNLTGTIAAGGTVLVNSSTAGLLHVSYMTSTPLIGTGSILNLQFNPLSLGTSPLTITNFLYNTDTIANITNGSITTIGMYGDIDTNGYVQAYDAALALQYSVGIDPLPLSDPRPWENWRIIIGNVDGADTITANDASLILQHSAGLITQFPVEGLKSFENPIADVTITQDNNELVLTSTGELYGLNINSINGSNVTLGTPTVLDPNIMSANNITGNTYNIGLCTAYAPNDNTDIMRIPFTCTAPETLTFNMIINKNAVIKTFAVSCTVGIMDNVGQTVNIYPNPANDKIEVIGLSNGTLDIINAQGQTIKTLNISNTKTTIDISKLSGGVYTLQIKTEKGIIVKKLIKQ